MKYHEINFYCNDLLVGTVVHEGETHELTELIDPVEIRLDGRLKYFVPTMYGVHFDDFFVKKDDKIRVEIKNKG